MIQKEIAFHQLCCIFHNGCQKQVKELSSSSHHNSLCRQCTFCMTNLSASVSLLFAIELVSFFCCMLACL
jgi:hypothetical protein